MTLYSFEKRKEDKINLYKLCDHNTSSVRYRGGNVMAWAFMAACGTRSLVFIDYVIADRSSRMTFKVYKAVHSAHIQPNATKLIQQRKMDNHANHKAKAIKEFVMVKK